MPASEDASILDSFEKIKENENPKLDDKGSPGITKDAQYDRHRQARGHVRPPACPFFMQ